MVMYKNKLKKPKNYNFDLIIIGSGVAGALAAHLATKEGKKVGLIEALALGGDNPHFGSIPTGALLKAAKTLREVQSAGQFGIRANAVSFNYQSVQAWKEKAINATGANNEASVFRSEGITLIRGHAHFLSPWCVSVGLKRYCAPKFLIATGALPTIPNIPGLVESGYITYRQAVHLPKFPKSLVIIGGGKTAYEFSQIFSAFGTQVIVMEYRDHLLPSEDPEVSDSAEAALSRKGIKVITSAKIVSVASNTTRKIIAFEKDDRQHRIAVEEIMVTCGKSPQLDLGLENTGVKYNRVGIHVNRRMQTNKKHIFAAGEVVSAKTPIHFAAEEGRVAAHNLFHKDKISINTHAVPHCLYGDPEIAVVGKTERDLIASDEPYQTAIAPIGIIGKSMTNNYTFGFVKIIATHSGILLGACIVAPDAVEMISELTFAVAHRHYACAISNMIHPFPSYGEAIRIAASKIKCS